MECREASALELLWPIIRQQLLEGLRTQGRPELKCLRKAGESYVSWLSVTPEELLVRWVNGHVGAGSVSSFEGETVGVRELRSHMSWPAADRVCVWLG